MASSSVTCLFGIFLIFAVIQLSSSFQCYHCGKLNSGCNDPFANETKQDYVVTCPAGTTACLKVENPEENDVFERLCSDADGCLTYKKCESCSEELCNASSNVIPSVVLIGIISTVFILRKF